MQEAFRASDLRAFEDAFGTDIIPLGRTEAARAAEVNASLAGQGKRIEP
ncbi:MAG: hypothetical protein QN122_08555 [Armatimonadota bacterium]|nr:hypothetical protein [Armatimonadota bacterium]MDR7449241.1 hypothetical protein [Armatimonadota bacterium]MDR7459304.1 hypothetical protein [Armatimonadota bacterium]MDR7478324.1 hypothetical protein [Armatimonadota bacterium]MDR7487233.1 hypothetical protein [Armatimonadota bacterium]